jgi:hypothetical protein
MAGGRWIPRVVGRRPRASVAGALVVLFSALLPSTSTEAPGELARSFEAIPPEGRGLDRLAAGEADSPRAAAGGEPAQTAAGPGDACGAVPAARLEQFDAFYDQVCWNGGIPVLASGEVDGPALTAAAAIVGGMLQARPDLREAVEGRGMKVAVLGRRERAVDLPESRDLPHRYPEEDWDAARAYSATADRPLLTAPEENLACQAADTYPGQQVLVHELGHSVLDLAVRPRDPAFWARVEQAYDQALLAGLWIGYYGATSAAEYWAEGVQAYFDAAARSVGPDPYGTPAATREALAAYDPVLHRLVGEVFADIAWRAPRCPPEEPDRH